MINKVNPSPQLPRPFGPALANWAVNMVQTLSDVLQAFANTINQLVSAKEAPVDPVKLPKFLKTAMPDPADWAGTQIVVTNETGGYTVAFSDGTNWRRVQDRAIVS